MSDVFMFRFKSPGMGDGLSYKVLSDDKKLLFMFLKQHNFDINMCEIEVTSTDILREDNQCKDSESTEETLNALDIYEFTSNKTNEVYKIATTYNFVHDAIEYTGNTLASRCRFGSLIMREDIEVFNIVSKIINEELPHVYAIEMTLIDPDTGEYYRSNSERWNKALLGKFPNDYDPDDTVSEDDSGIYESLFSDFYKGSVVPITLEAYVSFFASLLTDQIDFS